MVKYRVQSDDEVHTLDEQKLRKRLRSNDLTGLELVRPEGETQWVPLCETALFREEVPFSGDPLDAARGRQVKGFFGHLTGWFIVAGIMAAFGSWFPFWILIWGVFVGVHALKVAPSVLGLLGGGKLLAPGPPRLAEPTAQAALPPVAGRSPLAGELEAVRALLRRRGGAHAEALGGQLEQLATTLEEIAQDRADLEALLSPDALQELERTRAETVQRLEAAPSGQDRELVRLELEALEGRLEAVEHAKRTLARLQSRERVAEHHLEQLHLDLAQAGANRIDVSDFAARVEAVRHETAALEEVEELLADPEHDNG